MRIETKYFAIGFLVALAAACGDKKNNSSAPALSGSGTGAKTTDNSKISDRTPPAIINDNCKNPFSEPSAESLLQPSDLVRSKGTWVMKDQQNYFKMQYSYPDQATVDSLSPQLLKDLDENLSEVNEIELKYILGTVDWKNPPSKGPENYQVKCTTMNAPIDSTVNKILGDSDLVHHTSSNSLKTSARQNMDSTSSLAIDAATLVTKFVAKMAYTSDGVTPTFSLTFPESPTQKSLLEADLAHIPSNLKIQFIKQRDNSFFLRFTGLIKNTGKLSLSHSQSETRNNGTPVSTAESKEIDIPTTLLMVIQTYYTLENN